MNSDNNYLKKINTLQQEISNQNKILKTSDELLLILRIQIMIEIESYILDQKVLEFVSRPDNTKDLITLYHIIQKPSVFLSTSYAEQFELSINDDTHGYILNEQIQKVIQLKIVKNNDT